MKLKNQKHKNYTEKTLKDARKTRKDIPTTLQNWFDFEFKWMILVVVVYLNKNTKHKPLRGTLP